MPVIHCGISPVLQSEQRSYFFLYLARLRADKKKVKHCTQTKVYVLPFDHRIGKLPVIVGKSNFKDCVLVWPGPEPVFQDGCNDFSI